MKHVAGFALIALTSIVIPLRSHAALTCESVFAIARESAPREAWRQVLEPLLSATDDRLRQPFAIRYVDRNENVSLRPDARLFEGAKFRVAASPSEVTDGARVIRRLEFGYQLQEEFRRLGTINYVVVSREGKVLEIGGGSEELLGEVRSHLFGRKLSAADLKIQSDINVKLLRELRANPEATRRLREFAKKRGWPAGLEDEAGLAYFAEEIIPLREWASRNGYTLTQMRDAGWMLLKFDPQGRPKFETNSDDSIKIPFFAEESRAGVPIWRTRNLQARTDGKKYIGWQMDRSVERPFRVSEALYNGWDLGKARGKRVVITEGEFKCLVAQKASGILTVGIPGITQFDANIAQAMVAAQPAEIIVLLDRDPKGKGLMRVDEVTDSQRAAYSIARELERTGAPHVKVAILPDVFDGGKVGIDDLILAKGVSPYLETLDRAMSSSEYARVLGLDVRLQDLAERRQQSRKALDSYRNSAARGGARVSRAEEDRAERLARESNANFRDYLRRSYNGAQAISQPSARYPHIDMISNEVPGLGRKWSNNILLMDLLPSDLSSELCRPVPCVSIPEKTADIATLVNAKAGSAEMRRGLEVAKAAGFVPSIADDWAQVLWAGKLVHDFPLDDYEFQFRAHLPGGVVAPIVIAKKDGPVVAIAHLRTSALTAPVDGELLPRLWKAVRP